MTEWLANSMEWLLEFSNILNASIAASWMVLAVIVLRFFLKKAPKWTHVALWGLVAVRLLLPFSIESALSLIPSTETIPQEMLVYEGEQLHDSAFLDIVSNPAFSESVTVEVGETVDHVQISLVKMTPIWIAGIVALLAYTVISYLRLRRKVSEATILRDNIYQGETVASPFVLGIIRPRIYLPYNMSEQDLNHVVAHEQAHIRRRDHWWKPLGFLLLTIHWFNPLMWLAYVLLCRDIELACDEKVIKELGNEQRADYTQALVACSVNRRMIAACPLAFGEVGVKERVKSVMNYKKPAFWVIILAVIACAVIAVCFLTDPNPSREFSMQGNNVSALDPEAIVERILDIEDWETSNVYMNSSNFSLHVDSNFNWMNSQAISYFFSNSQKTYSAQLRIFPEDGKYFLTEPTELQEQKRIFLLRHYLEAVKYLPQHEIQQIAPADQYIIQQIDGGSPSDYDRVITYSSEGVQEIDGWFIHLQLQPLHGDGEGYHGTDDETIELFYGESSDAPSAQAEKWFDYLETPDEMNWDGSLEINLPLFPDVTFRWYPEKMEAVVGNEIIPLYTGMPILSTYFCDLTGDGLPELCSTLYVGSGMIDSRVIIYDYANGASYSLQDRGTFDYTLRQNESDGQLYVDKRAHMGGGLLTTGQLVFKGGTIQILGQTMPSDAIRDIIDPTDNPDFTYATAVEKIYEDENIEYFLSGLYSQYVIVHYTDGTQEDIITALNTGRATIADLDRFGIRYWAEPKVQNLDAAISAAILDHYASDIPDGLIHAESHMLLANEVMSGTPLFGKDDHAERVTAYLLVHYVKYSTYGGTLAAAGGSYGPAAITFQVSDTGEYILEEYWEPRDGSYYDDDIRDKFPGSSADDALNDQAYIEELKAETYNKALAYLSSTSSLDVRIAELLGEIQSSPAHSSNPGDYIHAHEAEYEELLGYGEYTLRYCFTEFLQGGQNDLRGHIMASVCQDISEAWGEVLLIDGTAPVTGQEWFDIFCDNAASLSFQFSSEMLEKYYPASWLLLELINTKLEHS